MHNDSTTSRENDILQTTLTRIFGEVDEKPDAQHLYTYIKNKIEDNEHIIYTKSIYTKETILTLIAKKNIIELSNTLANFILKKDINVINFYDSDNNTALMHAAISNNLEILPCLKKNNADSSIKNKYGETAFILAAKRNHRFFLEQMYNLNLEVTENDEKEALLILAENCHIDTAKLLLTKSHNQDSLLLFLNENKCTEILDDYILNSVKQEGDNLISIIYDEHGHANVLLFAALYGCTDILEKISEFNYKIDAITKNKKNQTAFILAASEGNEDFLEKMYKLNLYSYEDEQKSLLNAINKKNYIMMNFLISNSNKKEDLVIYLKTAMKYR